MEIAIIRSARADFWRKANLADAYPGPTRAASEAAWCFPTPECSKRRTNSVETMANTAQGAVSFLKSTP
jgi:hypothetical protein